VDDEPRGRRQTDVLLAISAGGALGSVARWGLGELVAHDADEFPWSTLVVNVSGALALGILMAFVLDVWSSRRLVRPFLGVGVLGGYTTFSTYLLDARNLLATGHSGLALTYLAVTLVVGVAAAWLGIVLGRLVLALGPRWAARQQEPTRSDR
jgi:CrcB protein